MKLSIKSSRQIFVVVQARLASTRLPAKALLPVRGIPAVVLCAKRAANTGLKVIVATSDEMIDDPIAEVLKESGVAYFRGPLRDVLKRSVLATAAARDEDIIVRLTADNLIPDGNFIETVVHQFLTAGVDYIGTSSPKDGLPYGLSAEVFSARVLRLADDQASSAFDREHVTPWIRRNSKAMTFAMQESPESWKSLRCTVDYLEDYSRILRIFDGVEDVVRSPWRRLIECLEEVSAVEFRCPSKVMPDGTTHSELVFGTAQLGLDYGIANGSGKPRDSEAQELLTGAINAGITGFDTARAYGDAEYRLGNLLSSSSREQVSIVTKLDTLSTIPSDADTNWLHCAVDSSIFESCHALRSQTIDTLLLHRWEHRRGWNGVVWDRLIALKESGIIRRLGASVYSPNEAIEALADPDIGHLQLPVNILDWRWRSPDFLNSVNRRPDIVIHARSVLLQGLLTLSPERWPICAGVDPYELVNSMDSMVSRFSRKNRIDLAIAYVRTLPWITGIVIGMESVHQLQENLRYFSSGYLSHEQLSEVNSLFSNLPEKLLNPARWKELE